MLAKAADNVIVKEGIHQKYPGIDNEGVFGITDLQTLYNFSINFLTILITSVAVVMFMYASYILMNSGGDKGKIEKAKNVYKNATLSIVGIFVIYILSGIIKTAFFK